MFCWISKKSLFWSDRILETWILILSMSSSDVSCVCVHTKSSRSFCVCVPLLNRLASIALSLSVCIISYWTKNVRNSKKKLSENFRKKFFNKNLSSIDYRSPYLRMEFLSNSAKSLHKSGETLEICRTYKKIADCLKLYKIYLWHIGRGIMGDTFWKLTDWIIKIKV